MTWHLTSPRVNDPKKRERETKTEAIVLFITPTQANMLWPNEGVKARRWHGGGGPLGGWLPQNLGDNIM